MRNSGAGESDAGLLASLNDLLQLDHDAVEAYTVAIDMVREPRYRETLSEFRADHKRHIEELAGLVRERSGLPAEMPHPTGVLKLAVQGLGSIAGDEALLLAFKAVEGQAKDKYLRASQQNYPTDVAAVIARASADEAKHYQWAERTLKERGVGEGTLPHQVAGVVETIHKALADPIEAATRQVMENVGDVVGTTRQRGGSAAPSPIDVAAGVMASSAGRDDRVVSDPVTRDRPRAPGPARGDRNGIGGS